MNPEKPKSGFSPVIYSRQQLQHLKQQFDIEDNELFGKFKFTINTDDLNSVLVDGERQSAAICEGRR